MVFKIEVDKLIEQEVKTTPENVKEANEGLFHNKMNFWEYLKYNPMTYENNKQISEDMS